VGRLTINLSGGQREDIDPKVMPDGALKRVENLRVRKEGGLGVRFGYAALGLTTQGSTSLVPYDLIGWNGRLLALGTHLSTTQPLDIYDYVAQPLFDWRPSGASNGFSDFEPMLCPVSSVRNMGRLPSQGASVTKADCAAAGGRVCVTLQTLVNSFVVTTVHVFRASDDATILTENITAEDARVVAVGPIFFIIARVAAVVSIWRFNPAADEAALTQLTDAFATGAAITALDARAESDDGGFVVAVSRSTPSVSVRRFDTAGAVAQTITGPAVTTTQLAVDSDGVTRVHLIQVDGTGLPDLYTYLIAGGALETGPTALIGGVLTTDRQPGLCILGSNVLVTVDAGTIIRTEERVSASHALVVGTDASLGRVNLNAKPSPVTIGSVSYALFGVISQDELLVENGTNLLIGSGGAPKFVAAAKDHTTGIMTADSLIPQIATDLSTSKRYWCQLVSDADGQRDPVVSEIVAGSTERRQTASIDGQLYIAGGVPQVYDGRLPMDAGFVRGPLIISATPSASTGALTPLATYAICCTFEFYDSQGRFHTSEPSQVVDVTMGATHNIITLTVSGPLSYRNAESVENLASAVKIVAFQSLPQPDKQLLRASSILVQPGNFGGTSVFVLSLADATIAEQGAIYTQGSSGARSGPNPFVAPLPARYIWPSADKLFTGGLPSPHQVQESRAAFPNEPITWARNLGGIGGAPERVLAVARLDERRVTWTANGLYEFTGDGLDINGVGDIGFPRRLPAPGGLHGGDLGWRSLVETSVGIFFQLAKDKIYLLPRGGGAPEWIGKPVRDTLLAFPVITSATYLKRDQTVCFTCNNEATPATDSVVLVYDLEYGVWLTDTDTAAIASSAELDGRLVLLQSGTVLQQAITHPASTFIATLAETGTFYPFGRGTEGQLDEIQLFAEFRGACNVICSLSLDDGVTYTALPTKALTGLTVGSTVTLKWAPRQFRGDRFRVKFETTNLSGASEQIVYNYAVVDWTSHNRSALRTTTQKG
jgi:hypothetical protein